VAKVEYDQNTRMSFKRWTVLFFFPLGLKCLAGTVVLSPTELELGRALKGEVLRGKVKITNTAPHEIRITDVIKDCSCTSAVLEKNDLPPGESTSLEVHIDAKQSVGTFNRNVTLVTTEGKVNIPLRITVVDSKNWDVKPLPVIFPTSSSTIPMESLVTVTPVAADGEVLAVKSDSVWLEARASKEGSNYTLKITRKKGAPVGLLKGRVEIQTNAGSKEVLSVPVYAVIEKGVFIHPNPVVIGKSKLGVEAETIVTVGGWDGGADVDASIDQGSVKRVAPQQPATNRFLVKVTPNVRGVETRSLRLVLKGTEIASFPIVIQAE
jgi:hypothetical protein